MIGAKKGGYRLLWFQHFHKAAGSTIVRLAKENGERLYPTNLNGNPTDSNGEFLALHEYDAQRIFDFVDHCESIGCTFVAPEWGVADFHQLNNDPRVKIVTCFREPYERFVSNYIYDYRMGWTNKKNIRDYVGSKRSFSYFNYYTHMLARLSTSEKTVAPQDFELALGMLDHFSHIGVVGNKDWLREFCNSIGWNTITSDIQINKTPSAGQGFLHNLMRLRPNRSIRMFKSAKLVIDPDFPRDFQKNNKYDSRLFATASEISKKNHAGQQ